jgi:hypothetical protein
MIMIDAIIVISISISEGLTFERIYEGKIKKMRFPPFHFRIYSFYHPHPLTLFSTFWQNFHADLLYYCSKTSVSLHYSILILPNWYDADAGECWENQPYVKFIAQVATIYNREVMRGSPRGR